PPKLPRSASPQSHNQATLEEAFPNIDAAVVRAVLVASRGDLEPAFNALLSMSDPSAVETPPPQPPRPRVTQQPKTGAADYVTSTPQTQLEADALYARQLQEHFGAMAPRQHTNASGRPLQGAGARHPRRHPNDDSDDEYYHADSDKDRPSFFEEDLPVIKENIKKGLIDTQTKVTGWFNEFKKRIENDVSPEATPPTSARPSGQYTRTGARRQTGLGGYDGSRRSRDGGYDADPQVLSDDFTHLNMKDNTGTAPRRPKANPNLFQPSATGGGRRVSFDDRPTTIESDDDLYRPSSAVAKRSSASPARQPSPVGNSKWEPLKSVDPEPMNKDPFSLEDSDDEKD
ncbi:hypothetical protein K440DRAFT_483404, partial [Wilcoxina mikolae CBS 423.85]